MAFDASVHLETLRLIEVGRQLRRDKGLPEERNVSILHKEGAAHEGKEIVKFTSRKVNHLPAPHEMQKDNGKFIVPRKDCPQCGEKESMFLGPLCHTCEDAKGENGEIGKYKSMWQCQKCKTKEKLEKHFVQILNELGVEFGTGTKESMGIQTYTDNGVK